MAPPKKLPKSVCEEPHHTKGNDIQQCRTCAKAVCMTCIVKTSMPTFNENIFQSRRRLLCKVCWDSGKSLDEHDASQYLRRVYSEPTVDVPYGRYRGGIGQAQDRALCFFCHCTPGRGTLCHACKTQELSEAQLVEARCTGRGCRSLVSLENYGGSRCRWCGLMCGPATRVERREIFRARRKSTIEHMNALAEVETPTEELSFDHLLSEGEHIGDVLGTRAKQQARFEVASDESFVQSRFGQYDAEEDRARNRGRFLLRQQAMMVSLRPRNPSARPLNPSRPLIREGEIPKSLKLFKPLVLDEQKNSDRDDDDVTGPMARIEEGDDDTLCDGASDVGTLKDGKSGGKGKIADYDDGEDDEDDAKTITSMGSTLYDRVEACAELAERNVVPFSQPPQYSSVIPTEADREWILFCARGF